jgi:putative DNA-invertase from lambdoid prophage Rac
MARETGLEPATSGVTGRRSGELVPHEAEQEVIREMVALRAQGKALRAIAEAVQARGHRISHEGVAGVLRAAGI